MDSLKVTIAKTPTRRGRTAWTVIFCNHAKRQSRMIRTSSQPHNLQWTAFPVYRVFWNGNLAEFSSKRPEKLPPATDRSRCKVPQTNTGQSCRGGLGRIGGTRGVRAPPTESIDQDSWELTEISQSVGVWPRYFAYMLWSRSLVFLWDSLKYNLTWVCLFSIWDIILSSLGSTYKVLLKAVLLNVV